MGRKSRRELYKSMGFLSSLGINMVVATLIGLAMGYYLDRWLGTQPWGTTIFLIFGVVAGFRNIFILTNMELKRQQENNDSDHDEG